MDELPLLELFTRLRQAGIPLGIAEYQLALKALKGGFGTEDRTALKRLCQMLWIKSKDDQQIFDFIFTKTISSQPHSKESQPNVKPQSASRSQSRQTSSSTSTQRKKGNTNANTSSLVPELVIAGSDEIQMAQEVRTAIAAVKQVSITKTIRPFVLQSDYFPVTRRQLKQSWRYLRRTVRKGPKIDLDINATVQQIGKQGNFLDVTLIPQRINCTELNLVIDRDGSMVPFHGLSSRLVTTAVQGGKLGKTNIYYFRNCPITYLYRDPLHLDSIVIKDWLGSLYPNTAAVLIFSDGGAARGSCRPQRLQDTETFLKQLRKRVKHVAWLNPVPKKRWQGTTAEIIHQWVPMFEFNRQGLNLAINKLRGR